MRNLIKIITEGNVDLAYFTDKEDIFFKLKGVEDPQGENMEFIEIGKTIILNDQELIVKDINIKFEDIKINRKLNKFEINKDEFKDFFVETIVTVKIK